MRRFTVLFVLIAAPALASAHSGGSICTRNESDLRAIEYALSLFEEDVGRLPTAEEGLSVLQSRPLGESSWSGPYLRRTLRDYWGREYAYAYDGSSFFAYSTGKNGIDESAQGDDISRKYGFRGAYYLEECTDWPEMRQRLRVQAGAALVVLFFLP